MKTMMTNSQRTRSPPLGNQVNLMAQGACQKSQTSTLLFTNIYNKIQMKNCKKNTRSLSKITNTHTAFISLFTKITHNCKTCFTRFAKKMKWSLSKTTNINTPFTYIYKKLVKIIIEIKKVLLIRCLFSK